MGTTMVYRIMLHHIYTLYISRDFEMNVISGPRVKINVENEGK